MNYKDIVSNIKIYDIEESIIASGYPMRTEAKMREVEEKDVARGTKLVEATLNGNTAHHQFLTGIRVNFDLTFTNKAWVEAERYKFLEFVSSQSTMHRITKFDLDSQYIRFVDPRIIEIMKEKVAQYNKLIESAKDIDPNNTVEVTRFKNLTAQKYLEILYSNPSGFRVTARMTTNYRCLRNIYIQRKSHRLPEWKAFCKWIETLPYADEFLTNVNLEEE